MSYTPKLFSFCALIAMISIEIVRSSQFQCHNGKSDTVVIPKVGISLSNRGRFLTRHKLYTGTIRPQLMTSLDHENVERKPLVSLIQVGVQLRESKISDDQFDMNRYEINIFFISYFIFCNFTLSYCKY